MVGDFLARALKTDEADALPEESNEAPLAAKIQETQRRIKRLYALYAAAEDDLLAESIEEQKRLLETLKSQAEDEAAQTRQAQEHKSRRERYRHLAEAWEDMTDDERRSVVQELIERVEIDGDAVTVRYRL